MCVCMCICIYVYACRLDLYVGNFVASLLLNKGWESLVVFVETLVRRVLL